MDLTLVKKLQAAGVPADTILSLLLDEGDRPPEPVTAPEAAPEQAPEPETETEPAAAPQTDAILEAINKLTGVIQASNIINAGHDGRKEESVDDILASLIAPASK